MRYELIIYWSREDQAFLAEVPELPGCMADGASYEEALANAQRVIAESAAAGDWATFSAAQTNLAENIAAAFFQPRKSIQLQGIVTILQRLLHQIQVIPDKFDI